jgi:hypothetical protein
MSLHPLCMCVSVCICVCQCVYVCVYIYMGVCVGMCACGVGGWVHVRMCKQVYV